MPSVLFLKDTSFPHCSVRGDRKEGQRLRSIHRGIITVEFTGGTNYMCKQKSSLQNLQLKEWKRTSGVYIVFEEIFGLKN